MIDTRFLLVIGLILLSTKALAIFMKHFHLPQVVGALVAGVLLGPAVFGLVEPNETISVIAEFGAIILLFSAGMETDYRQIKSSIKPLLLIAACGIIAPLGGGLALSYFFGYSLFESFFIGVIISSTSASITIEALQEMGTLKTKSGTAIMGAALLDDIMVIVILAATMGMGASGFSFVSLAVTLLKIAGFFVLALAAGLCVNKLFNHVYGRYGIKRRLTVFAIAYCFLMAYLAEWLGLAGITGAYIAGIAFCSTRCVEYLEARTHSLSYMFFTPVFLANIGFHTSFAGMNSSMALFTVLLVAVAILSEVVGCGLGAKICGFTNKESIQVGTGMVARGEVTFIIAVKGIAAGYISSLLFPSVIVVVLVTVLLTPLLLKAAYK
ncbi:MAG: cation:proton antiporter [Oscillospiraceae bacterium]|nr:cation:proton antiporter [Oscillospiraceae bacterium]